MATRAAQDRALVELISRPNLRRVIGQLSVTLMTRKPLTAALELDRDDVAFAVVVRAPRLFIHVETDDVDAVNLHVRQLRHALART